MANDSTSSKNRSLTSGTTDALFATGCCHQHSLVGEQLIDKYLVNLCPVPILVYENTALSGPEGFLKADSYARRGCSGARIRERTLNLCPIYWMVFSFQNDLPLPLLIFKYWHRDEVVCV